jgi:hypothetical protein
LRAAAQFVSATNFSCCQGASPATPEFVVDLIQSGACIAENDDAVSADAGAFIDHMTEREMINTSRVTGESKFAQTMKQLQEIRFINHVVDTRTVHSLKTIVCFLTSPHSAILPVLLSLQKTTNCNADDCAAPFV